MRKSISAGPNNTLDGTGKLYFSPGVVGAFTFASGVTLTGPIPNPGHPSGVLVGDFSVSQATWGPNASGTVASEADVPFGSAYLGWSTDPYPVEFTFASDVFRVGGFVSGHGPTVTLTAFDASGSALETVSVATGNVAQWGSNFISLERTEGIRKITLSGYLMVVDGLTFEVVPEPTTALLLACGLAGLAAAGRRRSPR